MVKGNDDFNYLENDENDSDSDSIEEKISREKLINESELLLKSKIKSGDYDVSEKILQKLIKEWILGKTFLIKIYTYLNKIAFSLRFSSYLKKKNNMTYKSIKGKNVQIKSIRNNIIS